MILRDLGADVIKIETSQRLDMLRLSGAFADGVRDHERSGWYAATNRGKRSITLDLKHPDGRALALDLAKRSDAAIENFSPGVLANLGLGHDVLSAVNPKFVLLSLSGYGATGPESSYVAYGDHLTYASGLASVIGHPDDGPTPINTFYGDPVAGMYGALAILAAIEAAERTGNGIHLEYAQVEGLLTTMPGPIAQRSLGHDVERLVDKSPTMAPHGFYRCAGDDAWVAIAVEDDEAWAALRELIDYDGDLPTFAERKAAESELDEAVSTWVAPQSPWQVTERCQAVGVAAYPLMNSQRLSRDAHLHQRDFFQWVQHPVTGPGQVPGVVFRIDGERAGDGAQVRGAAPVMGQHNEEVLLGLLGLSRERYDELVASGAVR